MLLVVDSPLTRILPELHEDTDDFTAGIYGCSKGSSTQAGGVYKVKKQSEKIDNELQFNYRAQVNLYSKNGTKKVIKKFYKFSNYEDIARNNINKQCLDYIKNMKLKNVKCVYMGTKPTEKILTALD